MFSLWSCGLELKKRGGNLKATGKVSGRKLLPMALSSYNNNYPLAHGSLPLSTRMTQMIGKPAFPFLLIHSQVPL